VGALVFALLCRPIAEPRVERLLFFEPTKGGVGKSPGEDVFLTTSDGVRIHGWYVTNPQAAVTLLWLHGNGANLETRRERLEALRLLPANVLLLDYRGYGRSEGWPSEGGVYRDARAAYVWLRGEKRVAPARLVIMGDSLGGGVAAGLASEVECGGLILQSTSTSIADQVGLQHPWIPLRRWLFPQFDTASRVARLDMPKLILHARDDEAIPFVLGERLYQAAKAPKECHWFEHGGHNAVYVTQRADYSTLLAGFLRAVAAAAPAR